MSRDSHAQIPCGGPGDFVKCEGSRIPLYLQYHYACSRAGGVHDAVDRIEAHLKRAVHRLDGVAEFGPVETVALRRSQNRTYRIEDPGIEICAVAGDADCIVPGIEAVCASGPRHSVVQAFHGASRIGRRAGVEGAVLRIVDLIPAVHHRVGSHLGP